MTPSSDSWGMKSLLLSSFFDPEIECNMVSTWLNPAVAVINPLLKRSNTPKLAAILGRRQPEIAPLWLGAIITGKRDPSWGDKNWISAVSPHETAWTGTVQTFIALRPGTGTIDTQMIRQGDECRLLFITANDWHDRIPTGTWKPFRQIHLRNTELEVQQSAHCNCHCFEYEALVLENCE